MPFHANAMAGPMSKVHSIARFLDHVARGYVYICARDAGLRRSPASSIGGLYDLVNLLRFSIHLPHGERARQVGDITVICCAPIDNEQVASPEFPLGR